MDRTDRPEPTRLGLVRFPTSHAEVVELFEARHPELAFALAAGDRPRLACVVIADASAASVVWWPVA